MKHREPSKCICTHKWQDHHLGIIMNPNFPTEDHNRGICGGLKAQECEATQVNGEWLVPEKKRCYCPSYKATK